MSSDYWLGVATPFAVAAGAGVLAGAARLARKPLKKTGLFVEFGAPLRKRHVTFCDRLEVSGGHGLYRGTYQTMGIGDGGWGSRWVALGPVTVGRKRADLGLTEKIPVEQRTPPRKDESYQWSGSDPRVWG